MSSDESSVSRREFVRKSALAGAAAAVSPALLTGCDARPRDAVRAGLYRLDIIFTGLCLFVIDKEDPSKPQLRVLMPATGGSVAKHEVRLYSPGWQKDGFLLPDAYESTIDSVEAPPELPFERGLVDFSTFWRTNVSKAARHDPIDSKLLTARISIPGGKVVATDPWQGAWETDENPKRTLTMTSSVTCETYVSRSVLRPLQVPQIPQIPDIDITGSRAWIQVRHAPNDEQEPKNIENMGAPCAESPHFHAYADLFDPKLNVKLHFKGHVGQPALSAQAIGTNLGMTPFTCMSGGGG